MEIIFKALAKDGKFMYPNGSQDVGNYLKELSTEPEGTELLVTMKPLAKVSQKIRMYAYLFGPLLDSAMRGYVYLGYNGIDKVAARYKLQAEFAKAELYNEKTKQTEIYLIDLSSMTKARLLQFITDCIFYIEEHLQQTIPDSAEYKAMKGDGFMSIKYKK